MSDLAIGKLGRAQILVQDPVHSITKTDRQPFGSRDLSSTYGGQVGAALPLVYPPEPNRAAVLTPP
jgi:hypothetical protein